MIFWVSDRWGAQKDCIGDALEAVHKDELNGEDSLTVVLAQKRLQKGDRLIWKDRWDAWHEHIVSERTTVHEGGEEYHSYYCENSIAETMSDYVEEVVAENSKAKAALTTLLAGTRWQVGAVDDFGLRNYYHFNECVHDGISKAIELWGGEFSTSVEVSGEGVSSRKLNLQEMRGEDGGRLFVYGYDMDGVRQEVAADDVVTRLHCFGKATGYSDPEAGYTERLTFAAINGGRDYLDDDDAKMLWGLPDGNGGVKHAEGVAVFESCDDEGELMELGAAELRARNHPHVSYTASLAVLSDYGYDYQDARTGDKVAMRDKTLDLRLQGRVTCITRYLVNASATVVEMGDSVRSITDVVRQQAADLGWVRAHADTWDEAAMSNESWLNRFMDNLNAQFDAAGSNVNVDPETGITVYDDAENPTMAIQINGMGFRIADGKNTDGSWDWRTFGTGHGFSADEIVTGQLLCGNNTIDLVNGTVTLRNGLIQDSQSGNFWNLGTGELRIANTARFTDKSGNLVPVDDLVNAASDVSEITEDVARAKSEASKAWSKVNALSVGGTNLLTGTNVLKRLSGTPRWSDVEGSWGGTGGTGTRRIVDVSGAPNNSIKRGFLLSSTVASQTDVQQTEVPVDWGQSYVLSCYAKSDDGGILYMAAGHPEISNPERRWKKAEVAVTNQYRRYYLRFIASNEDVTPLGGKIAVVLGLHSAGSMTICGMKLERGTVPTDWSENPYDTEKTAVDAATAAYNEAKTYTNAISATDREFSKAQRQALDDSLTQANIFKRLTNNGQTQGLYLHNGKVYINGTYIASGTIDAGIVKAGILIDQKGKALWNMATGYFRTSNAVMDNANVTGQFTCGTTYKVALENGQMRGYRNNALHGFIDATSSIINTATGQIYKGLQMQTEGCLRVSTPVLAVSTSSYTGDTATIAFTGRVKLNNVTHSMNKKMTSCKTGYVELKFVNGICTGVTEYTPGLVSITTE